MECKGALARDPGAQLRRWLLHSDRLATPDSVESKWVKEEWTDAFWDQTNTERIKLAPVLHRDCRIPHFLRNKKPFDLRTNQPEGFRQIRTWLLGLRPAPPPVVHLPQRSPLFIGREPEIETLRTRLKEEGSVAYIAGLAGRGKTTLALEYAHRHQRDYESVHWLPCQKRTLVQIVGELAFQLGLKLDGDLDTIVRELNGHCARKRCLIVLDNVEDDTPARLLPGGRTSLLITTRFNTLRFLRSYQPLNLPLFTEEQCFELFIREIGKEEVDKHRAGASALFKRLGNLPIAIAVTASLIREDIRYTVPGMARNLRADATALLREAVSALSSTARKHCSPPWLYARRRASGSRWPQKSPASMRTPSSMPCRKSIPALWPKNSTGLSAAIASTHWCAKPPGQRMCSAEGTRNRSGEFENWETNWRECEKDMADWQSALSWLLGHPGNEVWPITKDLASRGYSLTRHLGRWPEAYEICERMAREANRRGDGEALCRAITGTRG